MNPAARTDHATTLVLMKGPEADATLAAIAASGQDVEVYDEGPYWKLNGKGDIHVDIQTVSEELGAPLTIGRWLVSMSSFVGYAETGESHFTVHAERGGAINRAAPGQ